MGGMGNFMDRLDEKHVHFAKLMPKLELRPVRSLWA